LGISLKDKAPVEVTITFSSTSTPFNEDGSLPVAITIFLALTVSFPSFVLTETSFGPVIFPYPLT